MAAFHGSVHTGAMNHNATYPTPGVRSVKATRTGASPRQEIDNGQAALNLPMRKSTC